MSKSGGKGSIIANTSSMGMRVPSAPEMTTSGVYAASKAGADMLMKYAAIEVRTIGLSFCRVRMNKQTHICALRILPKYRCMLHGFSSSDFFTA